MVPKIFSIFICLSLIVLTVTSNNIKFRISTFVDVSLSENSELIIFYIIPKISIIECVHDCKTRRRCQFINYIIRSNTCFLLGMKDVTSLTTPGNAPGMLTEMPGYLFGVKSEWDLEDADECATCPALGTCSIGSIGSNVNTTISTVCRSSGCDDPLIEDNSVVLGTQYIPSNSVKHLCDTGYVINITTTNVAHCQENGTWTHTGFSCDFDCGTMEIENGQFSAISGTTEGRKATVTCDIGYLLSGSSLVTCTEYGWDGSAACTVIDCGPPVVDNGQYTASSATTYGMSAALYCNPGYDFSGDTVTTCTENGWDGSATCTPMDCGQPPPFDNGQIDTSGGTILGNIAIFNCDQGYANVGDTSTICSPSGWDGSASCLFVDCGPPVVDNGQYTASSGTTYGMLATLYCNPGYDFSGDTVATCTVNGWDGSATCTPMDCGQPPPLDNGQIDTSGGTILGNTATFNCDQGYANVGDTSTTCSPSGWDGSASCVDCGDPTPPYGTTDSNVYTYGSEIRIICDSGFTLWGDASITCQADGSWSNTPACGCPASNQTLYEMSCYVVVTTKMSWANAKSYCESLGGHLADIKSQGEQSFIRSLISSTSNGACHWLGGNDKVQENQFRWSDNTRVSDGYKNWEPGQPDSSSGGEDCMDLIPDKFNYRWNDNVCTYKYRSICQIDL